MELGQALAVGRPQFQDQPIFDADLIKIEGDAEGTSVVRDFGRRSKQLDFGCGEVADVDPVVSAQLKGQPKQVLVKVHVAFDIEGIELDQLFTCGCGDAEADATRKVRHRLAVFTV